MSDKQKGIISDQTAHGTPGWFAREVLGFTPYEWQDKVMWDVATGSRPVTLRAANGSGKTQGIATVLLLWHCAVFPKSQVVTTAGVYRQVKEQLWGNIHSHADRLGKGWKLNETNLTAPNGSKAIGFSTDDPHKFEGWHNEHLLLILDEAKSIPDEIWQAVQRCNAPDLRILIMSSTGKAEGFFADSFHGKREFFSQHTVTAHDCPHLSDEWIQGQLDYWGEDHWFVQSMIYSKFREVGVTDFVVAPSRWANCADNPPEPEFGIKTAFIDWAAGGDENVIAIVNGNVVTDVIAWTEADTMSAANKAAGLLVQKQVPVTRIFADDGGLGHPINDALAANGFPVRRILNNWKASQPEYYQNLGSELWHQASRQIEQREVVLPDDDITMKQATSRKSVVSSANKMGLERKEDMKARGLTSPDRADAVLSAIAVAKMFPPTYADDVQWNADDDEDGVGADEYENQLSGAFAGL
jgi:hypothetical protein